MDGTESLKRRVAPVTGAASGDVSDDERFVPELQIVPRLEPNFPR